MPYNWFIVRGNHAPYKAERVLDDLPKLNIKDKTLVIKKVYWGESLLYAYRPSNSKNVSCADYDMVVSSKLFYFPRYKILILMPRVIFHHVNPQGRIFTFSDKKK